MGSFTYIICSLLCFILLVTESQAAIVKTTVCKPILGKICLGKPCLYLSTKVYTDGDHVTKIVCNGAARGTIGTWTKYTAPATMAPPAVVTPPCSPHTTASCVDQPCDSSQLGSSLMQLDKKNIIICLLNDDGTGYEWKSMIDDYEEGPTWSSTTQFYEDTEGSWVGDTCPTGKILTGMSTINVGMGGHNYWSIDCK